MRTCADSRAASPSVCYKLAPAARRAGRPSPSGRQAAHVGERLMAESDLNAIAFPTLRPEQVDDIARCASASIERHAGGTTVIEAGDREFKFHIVKSGAIAIYDVSGDSPSLLVEHGP